MISSDVIRGYTDILILGVLRAGDSYGYKISKEITKRSDGAFVMKETTLYSAFARLLKVGMIDSYYGEQTFGKRRTYYKITPLGVDHYRQKCEEWQQLKPLIEAFIEES